MLIEDPKTGHVAEVTHEGFLRILGVAIPWETHHSYAHESAYATGNFNATMSGSEQCVLWIRNDSQTDNLLVTGVVGSTDDTAGVKFTMYQGADAPTAGHTQGGAQNLNLTSRNVAEVTQYYGDSMTVANGSPVFTGYISQGMQQFPLGAALILGYLDTVHICINGTAAKNATVGLRFFFHGGRF